MRTFEHFNEASNDPCPICGTKVDKPVTLATIEGTNERGLTYQAKQIHIDCLELMYNEEALGKGVAIVHMAFELKKEVSKKCRLK